MKLTALIAALALTTSAAFAQTAADYGPAKKKDKRAAAAVQQNPSVPSAGVAQNAGEKASPTVTSADVALVGGVGALAILVAAAASGGSSSSSTTTTSSTSTR